MALTDRRVALAILRKQEDHMTREQARWMEAWERYGRSSGSQQHFTGREMYDVLCQLRDAEEQIRHMSAANQPRPRGLDSY